MKRIGSQRRLNTGVVEMDWDGVAGYALMGLGMVGVIIGLAIVYIFVCVLLGLGIEMIMGWLGHEMADWYWTGVGLIVLLGAVISVKKSDD